MNKLSTQLRIGNWIDVYSIRQSRWKQMQIMSGSDIEEIQKAEEDPENDRFRPIPLDDNVLGKMPEWFSDAIIHGNIRTYMNEDMINIHSAQNLYFCLVGEELDFNI